MTLKNLLSDMGAKPSEAKKGFETLKKFQAQPEKPLTSLLNIIISHYDEDENMGQILLQAGDVTPTSFRTTSYTLAYQIDYRAETIRLIDSDGEVLRCIKSPNIKYFPGPPAENKNVAGILRKYATENKRK